MPPNPKAGFDGDRVRCQVLFEHSGFDMSQPRGEQADLVLICKGVVLGALFFAWASKR